MNTPFLLRVFERMHDRKLPGMVEEASAGSVSERTVRNWISNRTTPDPTVLEEARAAGRKSLLKSLEGKQWPAEERIAFVDGLHRCPGFVSGFAFTLQGSSTEFPAFVQLASQVDLLEQALDVHRANDDLHGWVQTFLDAPWIRDAHLTHPNDGSDAEATRRQVRMAKSWQDLVMPVCLWVVHTQLQLVATLDLEFCSSYLPGHEATPIFTSLLPCLNPRVDVSNGVAVSGRNLFRYPTRRLLDLTACLRMMREKPGRKWPKAAPAAGAMARWLDLAGHHTLASNLPKWRSGRLLTAERFRDLWGACFEFVREADRPPAPMAMLYAVTVFTEMFVKGSREDGNLNFITPEPELYLRWWEPQREALSAGAQPPRFGTEKWLPGPA